LSSKRVLGVDVGGTSIKGGFVDETGAPSTPLGPRATRAGDGEAAVVGRIVDFVADLRRAAEPSVGAIGIGVPGIVDEGAGVAVHAVNLPFRNVSLARRLEEATGLPVTLGHDVRRAALGEGVYGAARGYSDYLFVSVGTGVGAAVVLGGRAYSGAHLAGGELGHMVVAPGGPKCACGRRGCIEAVASARAVEAAYRSAGGDPSVNATDLPGRIAARDDRARAVWAEAMDALALGLTNYVTLLDPQAIVVGGGLAAAGPTLVEGLTERVAAALLPFQTMPVIVLGELGRDAGWRGAAAAAWELVER
jgi:glucokinase